MAEIKIAVTGANGQLGRELQMIAPAHKNFNFIFLSREALPVENHKQVQDFFRENKPAYCINCAAYTAVDKAESEKDIAFLINGEATGSLAGTCNSFGTKLFHISTDYVFDGNASSPIKEDDLTSPINVYGASKLKGEGLAMQKNNDTIIIRTSWLYSAFGNNFVKTMIRLMNEKTSINVVNDQLGSPTYAADLASVIMQIINSNKFIAGIYHYSNEGEISWYDFALAIKKDIDSNCEVKPVASSQYPTAAKRPRYSVLDKTKIKSVYDINIRQWRSSLASCIEQLKNKEYKFSYK